jgi:parvulin-like peptidyl-prolyl isomerase
MSTPKNADQSQHPKHHSTRKTLTYAATVILLVIVVVAFVGTPALSGVASGNRLTFGSYDGDEIIYTPGNYFARQYQQIAQQVQDQGQQVTDLLFRQVWLSAFRRTVLHEALLDLAEGADAGVSSQAVDRAVARWPEFQVDGRFSLEEYNATSSQYRFQLRDYLQESLTSQMVQNDFVLDADLSDAEREFLLSMAGPERQFRFVQFTFAQFPDDEIIAYGEENSRRFDQINLSVITISSNETEAERIREQAVNRTSTFEDLARNQSTDSYSDDGGEMGWVFYNELEPDFESTDTIDEIFSLEVGEISPVLETTFGWAIYRANEAPIAADFTDPETVSAVRDYVQIFERGLVEDYLTEQADAFIAQASEDGFDAAATTVDQLPSLTEYFPINYGSNPYFPTVSAQTNQTIAEGAYQESFFITLFSLEDDEISDPVVLRDTIFVFQLADERAPQSTAFLEAYLPFIVQEIVNGDMNSIVVDQDKLVDNFSSAYNRFVLGQ